MSNIVASPDRSPIVGGLFSVLTFRGDGERWQTGVTFPGQTCGLLPVTEGPGCPPEGYDPDFQFDRVMEWGEIPEAFTVSGQFSCSPVGVTLQEAESNALEDLQRHEEATAEKVLWDTQLSTAEPLEAPSGPVSVDVGLGVLEHHIAREYGSQGVIHAPRWLIPSLDVELRGQRLVTRRLGTPVVAGGGYGDVGESDLLVATPALLGFRSAAEIVGDPTETFDRGINLVQVLAQRTYLIGLDTCPPASVQLDPAL